MKRLIILAAGIVAMISISVCAVDPESLLDGYEKTHWGQTHAEVKALYPEAEEVVPQKRTVERTVRARDSQQKTNIPTLIQRQLVIKSEYPVEAIVFTFVNDKLYQVTVRFHGDLLNAIHWADVEEAFHEKYDAVIERLEQAGIFVYLNKSPTAQIKSPNARISYAKPSIHTNEEQIYRNALDANRKRRVKELRLHELL